MICAEISKVPSTAIPPPQAYRTHFNGRVIVEASVEASRGAAGRELSKTSEEQDAAEQRRRDLRVRLAAEHVASTGRRRSLPGNLLPMAMLRMLDNP